MSESSDKEASSDDLDSGDDFTAEAHPVSCTSSKTGRKAKSKKSVKARCSKNQMGSEETRQSSIQDQLDIIAKSMEELASRMTQLEASIQMLYILVKDMAEAFRLFNTPSYIARPRVGQYESHFRKFM